MHSLSVARAIILATSVTLFLAAKADANDKFTCWQPNSKAVKASVEYWTKERRDKALPDAADDSFGTEPPHKLGSAERVNISEAPYKFGGKLFFTRGKQDYAASAQFVEDDNIVLAAAHSMWKGTDQATNLVFFRGYDNGGGTAFAFDQAAILTAWKAVSTDKPTVQRAALDYSVLRATTPSDAGKFTLGIGLSFTDVTMMGYPGALDSGKYMYKQVSTKFAQIGNGYEARPNSFGHGTSGGAWFVPVDSSFAAVSTVSGGGDTRILGPAFTEETRELIGFVKAGCK